MRLYFHIFLKKKKNFFFTTNKYFLLEKIKENKVTFTRLFFFSFFRCFLKKNLKMTFFLRKKHKPCPYYSRSYDYVPLPFLGPTLPTVTVFEPTLRNVTSTLRSVTFGNGGER